MKGIYSIRVENARVQFKLTLTRSLTLIRGMSATGKTTLVGAREGQRAKCASLMYLQTHPRRC